MLSVITQKVLSGGFPNFLFLSKHDKYNISYLPEVKINSFLAWAILISCLGIHDLKYSLSYCTRTTQLLLCRTNDDELSEGEVVTSESEDELPLKKQKLTAK